MGSGGSRTLWPPSYGASVKQEFLEIVHFGYGIGHHLAEIYQITASRADDDDDGILKREMSN